jgi:ribosome-binding protein aMBF1 (putative translation factor)
MASMYRIRQETIERLGPEPTTPTERLAHTLAAHEGTDDSWVVVEATNNVYGQGVRTGLTLGDLRALHQQLTSN